MSIAPIVFIALVALPALFAGVLTWFAVHSVEKELAALESLEGMHFEN